jgi:heme-degrading monooxygenase HmoA
MVNKEISMLELTAFDPVCSIEHQLGTEETPVILVNPFTVERAHIDDVVKAWEADALWLKKQPGFISTQLHKAIEPSTMFFNYAVWESTAHFRAAFTHPDFQSTLAAYPNGTTAAPHLFKRVAVSNLCTV